MVLLLLFVIIILLADIFREEMVRLQESCQGKKLGVIVALKKKSQSETHIIFSKVFQ